MWRPSINCKQRMEWFDQRVSRDVVQPVRRKVGEQSSVPTLVQTKMDGMRFNAIVKDGKVEFRSRNGKEIQLLGNLEKEFAAMAGMVDCVFDGELLVKEDGEILDRQTGNGILNKANKGTISATEASKVHATVWDVIPYAYFIDGLCPVAYGKRWESLRTIYEENQSGRISLVDSWEIDDLEKAQTLFEYLLATGKEGIILKDKNGFWEDKRAKHQIKFKGELECDLKIVGLEEGNGKYAGMLGAILCDSADGVVKVRVGSGFNDEHRKNLGQEILDKIVAVKYNMRIKNKLGDESLFLPIFVEIRSDKEVADSSEDIK